MSAIKATEGKPAVHDAEPQEKRPVILRNWQRYRHDARRLEGFAYGHPRFADGTPIITSLVQWIDEQIGMARTLNTVYILRDRA